MRTFHIGQDAAISVCWIFRTVWIGVEANRAKLKKNTVTIDGKLILKSSVERPQKCCSSIKQWSIYREIKCSQLIEWFQAIAEIYSMIDALANAHFIRIIILWILGHRQYVFVELQPIECNWRARVFFIYRCFSFQIKFTHTHTLTCMQPALR